MTAQLFEGLSQTDRLLGLWGMGPLELSIILVIVLLIFGAGKLPKIGKQLGDAMNSFKKAKSGLADTSEEATSAEAKKEEVEIEPA